MSIKKAVILAAGKGTRLLPITNSIPKPMLPVLNKPIIHYIVEESFQAGIEEIVIIVNHQSHIIEDYFKDYENIFFVKQGECYGTAHALWKSKIFIKDEDFALLLGDELTYGKKNCLKQLIDIYNINKVPFVTGLEKVAFEKIKEFNSVTCEETGNPKVSKLLEIEEKPRGELNSNITSIGRYVFSNSIYDILENAFENLDFNSLEKEIYLTFFLNEIVKKKSCLGVFCDSQRYELGNVNSWLNANVEIFNKEVLKDVNYPHLRSKR